MGLDRTVRKLGPLLRELRQRRASAQPQEDELRIETIEAVLPNGHFIVRGAEIPSTGTVPLRAGQKVPVVYKQGQPVAIFAHAARRAQFPPSIPPSGGGIVEELYIATDPDTGNPEVFFRNYDQISPLHIVSSGQVTNPLAVYWGQRRDSFIVQGDDAKYYVFTIARNPRTIIPPGQKITKATLVRVDDRNNFPSTLLSTVTFTFARASQSPLVVLNGTQVGGNISLALGTTTRLTDDANLSREVAITLAGGVINLLNGTGLIENSSTIDVGPPSMDEDLNVFLALRFSLNATAYQSADDPNITGSRTVVSDAATACPINSGSAAPQPFNGPFRNGSKPLLAYPPFVNYFQSYFYLQEDHLVLINLTTGAVIFSTLVASKTLACEETYEGLCATPVTDPNLASQFGVDGGLAVYGARAAFGPNGAPFISNLWPVSHTRAATAGTTCWFGLGEVENSPDVGFTFFGALGELGDMGLLSTQSGLYNAVLPVIDQSLLIAQKPNLQATRAFGNITPSLGGQFGDQLGGGSVIFFSHSSTYHDFTRRYAPQMYARTWGAKSGSPMVFLAIVREALRPVDVPATADDPHQYAVFVIRAGVVTTLINFTTTVVIPTIELLAGNNRRVLFAVGDAVHLADLDEGLLAQVGTNKAAFVALLLSALTNPDFLYNTLEGTTEPPPPLKGRFFVNAWNRVTNAITLNQAASGFPQEDRRLVPVKTLRNLPEGFAYLGGTNQSYQTINDTALLTPLGRFTRET